MPDPTSHEPRLCIFQFPEPVRIPAFIAAIREDGALTSKTIIPIPIQATTETTPAINPFVASQTRITEPNLPIRAATVNPGKSMIPSFVNSKKSEQYLNLIKRPFLPNMGRTSNKNHYILFLSFAAVETYQLFFIFSGLTIDSTAANLVPSEQVAKVPHSLVHLTRNKRQLFSSDNSELLGELLLKYFKNKRRPTDRKRKSLSISPKTSPKSSRTRSERQVINTLCCLNFNAVPIF